MGTDPECRYVPVVGRETVWTTLPGLDRAAVTHALQRLPLIRAVLAGCHAQMACFHIDVGGRRRRYACSMWRGDLNQGFTIGDATAEMTHATLSEICGALAPLARDLAARWPERARPGVIGIGTDGHRIIFNADHPSCRDEAWLDEHIAGRSPGAIIADDGTPGILETISPVRGRSA